MCLAAIYQLVEKMPDLIILLPTKNEEEGVGEVIDRIPMAEIAKLGFTPNLFIADGKSTDLTCKIGEERGARIVHQKGSDGKGNGVRQALEVIFNEFGDDPNSILIMLDADATYSPEDIPRFIDSLQKNDVVWGSRLKGKIEKKAMSKTNWLGNWILSMAASIIFIKRTTDLCTGYWGFNLNSLRKLPLTAEGFNLEADLFTSVVKAKMRTKEIPIDYAHREGESSLRWYKDGPRILMMTISQRFS